MGLLAFNIVLAVSLLTVIGLMGYFIMRQFHAIDYRDKIIATMVRQNYTPDAGVISEMMLDDAVDKDLPEAGKKDLIDTAEMTEEDFENLNQ